MQAAVKALTGGKGALDVKLCQLVNLFDKGEPVRMSKRAGTFVTLREVVDEVGKDVFRFVMLTRRNDQALDFDFAKVVEQSKDNPVFYVQYAHARARSVLRHAAEELPGASAARRSRRRRSTLLTDPTEMALDPAARRAGRASSRAPPRRTSRTASRFISMISPPRFHGLWNKGKDDASLRFIATRMPRADAGAARAGAGGGFRHRVGAAVFGVSRSRRCGDGVSDAGVDPTISGAGRASRRARRRRCAAPSACAVVVMAVFAGGGLVRLWRACASRRRRRRVPLIHADDSPIKVQARPIPAA